MTFNAKFHWQIWKYKQTCGLINEGRIVIKILCVSDWNSKPDNIQFISYVLSLKCPSFQALKLTVIKHLVTWSNSCDTTLRNKQTKRNLYMEWNPNYMQVCITEEKKIPQKWIMTLLWNIGLLFVVFLYFIYSLKLTQMSRKSFPNVI